MTPPGAVLLSGVVGSTAYGLAGPGSDVDRLGVFAAPTVGFHGLTMPAESHVLAAPDITFHEAGKWLRLALNGNPTVTELVWLDDYETVTPLGRELIGIRSSLLSAKRVRDAYLGYATQQFTRLRNRGDGSFSADTRKRTAKHARHLWRLLFQGVHLHRTGELMVRLPVPAVAACREFGGRVADGEVDHAASALRVAEGVFDLPGVLPPAPDRAVAQAWLLRVRRAYYSESTEERQAA